jgi:hypothetical protein
MSISAIVDVLYARRSYSIMLGVNIDRRLYS